MNRNANEIAQDSAGAVGNRADGPGTDGGPAAWSESAAGPQVYARVAARVAARVDSLGARHAHGGHGHLSATLQGACRDLLRGAFPRLIHALLPCACVLCHAVQPDVVCAGCAEDLLRPEPRCTRCALPGRFRGHRCPGCHAQSPPFDAAVTLGDYDPERAALVLALKFGGKLPLAGWLAEALARRWHGLPAPGAMCDVGGTPRQPPLPDLVIPVPLAPGRLATRGFNQSWEIARRFARHLGVPAHATGLARPRDTTVQSTLDLNARQANMAGAFCLSASRGIPALAGLHVAVVDDVMTTGATLADAATVLKRHGAACVTVVTALRTP